MRNRPGRAVVLMLLLLASPHVLAAERASAETPDAEQVLAGLKQATGGDAWDGVAALHVVGELRTSGLEGSFESWEDVTTGRYVNRYDLGVAAGAEGFDGEQPWVQDSSGAVTVTDSRGDLESAANQAYLTARGYWFAQRWPAEVRDARRVEEDGAAYHVVEVHPRRGRPAELWIDADTGRLARLVEEGAQEVTTTHFSDYEQVEGLLLPFAVRSSRGEERYDTHLRVTAVEVLGTTPEGTFERPTVEIDDFEVLGGGVRVEIPFELLNNHIYVMASINGAPPRRFLVDTGGLNVLTESAAAELGIASQGALEVRGAGEGKADVGVAGVDSLTVGDVRLSDQRFIVIDMDEIAAAEGIELSGLVGFELFRRFVVEIDYAGRRLVLTRPEAFRYQGDGVRVPFRFDHRTPVVEGAVDGVGGTFTLDTGSRGGLALHGPFVAEHDLERRYTPRVERLTGWGVGGGVRGQPVGPRTLTLGSLEIPDVATELTRQSAGAFTDRYTAGNVGGAVLKRFRVIFDYTHQIVIFEPNEAFDAPDGADRSGLWINLAADGFRVADVVPGGPAAAAGVEVGDLIVAVDGTPVHDLSLSAVREAWRRQPAGTAVLLTVVSGGERAEVRMVLRDLV